MITTLLRAGALTCALMTTTALTAPALAQASDIPPPVRYQTDENGIDVARGEHLINVTDVSIGPAGEGGMAYTRQLRRTGGAGNPYDMGLFQDGAVWTATVGLASYTFSRSGTLFSSTDGSGATLVETAGPVRTLTLADGTEVVYDNNLVADDDVRRRARASRVDWPNGERLTLHWTSTVWCNGGSLLDDCAGGTWETLVRLQAVENALRYQLHFTYARSSIGLQGGAAEVAEWKQLTRVSAVNTIHQACDPLANDCGLTAGAWPEASYAADGSVTDPEGRVSRYTSDSTTFRIRPPGGNSSDEIVYSYGADNRIDSVVRDGMTWTYNYSVAGNAATLVATDPGGHSRTIVSDLAVGLPTSVTNEVGRTTSYQYDSAGRLIRTTAPEGNYVENTYDSRGNLTETRLRDKAGNAANDIVTSATYPASCADPETCNRPINTTDANGNVTNYAYDTTHGGVTSVTLPAPAAGAVRPQTRYSYTPFPMPGGGTTHRLTNISQCQTQVSCNGTADEAETAIDYNHSNLLASAVTRRSGNGSLSAQSLMTYDPVGNLLTVNGPLAGTADTVRTRYNLAREVTGTISPDPDGAGALEPRAQRITRSATTGLVTRIETGTVNSQSDADWTTFAMLERVNIGYDAHERPVRQTLMGSDLVERAQTQTSYDNEGRLQCTAVRMNPAEYDTPPPDACTLDAPHATYGPDRISHMTYDAANRLILVQTGFGTADQANEAYTPYTPNGRVSYVNDANGNRTTFEYDGHDRLVRTRFPLPTNDYNSSETDDEILTLDDNGNVLTRTLRDATSIAYSYDALNRLRTKNPPGTEPTVTYGYDNLNRMISASRTGHALTFSYDALGRNLTQAGPLGTAIYQYDLAGRRTELNYPGTGLIIDYDYLVTGEVSAIREKGATSGFGVLATFGYDQLGRRTSLTRGDGSVTTYGYDAVSRLNQLVHDLPGTAHDLTQTLGYNPANQIIGHIRSNDLYSFTGHANDNVAYANNGRNEVTGVDGAAVTYDARRNIATLPALASGMGTAMSYTYNSENMLVSGGGITLNYDPLMRLYQAGSHRWAYDGANMIAEYSTSNVLLRRFVHVPGTGEPIVWYDSTGVSNRRWLHADERGSIIAVSAANTVMGINRYDEYGVPDGANIGRFRYTGQAWITALGMYHYRARFYNPTIGRFMQTDPIGYGSGMNLYAYVRNDPVNLVDPSGMTPEQAEPMCTGTRICLHDGGGSASGFVQTIPGPSFSGEKKTTATITWSDGSVTFEQGPWVPITNFGGGSGANLQLAQWQPGGAQGWFGGGATGSVDAGPVLGVGEEADEETIVVIGTRGLAASSQAISPPPNFIYFGYPPEPNATHHTERRLRHLSSRNRAAVRAHIVHVLSVRYPYIAPERWITDFVVFQGQQYEFRAFGLPGGITNVGTVFPVDD